MTIIVNLDNVNESHKDISLTITDAFGFKICECNHSDGYMVFTTYVGVVREKLHELFHAKIIHNGKVLILRSISPSHTEDGTTYMEITFLRE